MKIVKSIKGGDIMIWYDMSYNQFEPDLINKLDIESEENESDIEDITFEVKE